MKNFELVLKYFMKVFPSERLEGPSKQTGVSGSGQGSIRGWVGALIQRGTHTHMCSLRVSFHTKVNFNLFWRVVCVVCVWLHIKRVVMAAATQGDPRIPVRTRSPH